jgi:uncharacterized protein (TIGR03435 family)
MRHRPYAALLSIGLTVGGTIPAFEVASVKPNRIGSAGAEGATREKVTTSPETLTMQNVSLQSCLKWAYGLRDFQISGPGWLATERYDISAKAAASTTEDQLRLMLKTLLTERFKLKTRIEKKDRPVYALVVAKNGPKLHKSATDGASDFGPAGGELVFRNFSMADLADRLSTRPFKLDLPVFDEAGLAGRFDFALRLADNADELKHSLERMEQGPSVFVFFQQQLGLKLETRKAPLDLLVVESAEKVPSGN